MQSKTKLAIFDLDGTLFDTKDVNYLAYKEAIKKFNVELDYVFFCKECNGNKYSAFLPKLHNFTDDELKQIHEEKKLIYPKYLSEAKINADLFNIIDGIKNSYFLALVTTASKKNTFELLVKFGKEALFDLVLTQDDISRPKPDPEGFLLAQRYFNVGASNTIVFEDSDIGVSAASRCTDKIYIIKGFN